jgi:hypothetical protein
MLHIFVYLCSFFFGIKFRNNQILEIIFCLGLLFIIKLIEAYVSLLINHFSIIEFCLVTMQALLNFFELLLCFAHPIILALFFPHNAFGRR